MGLLIAVERDRSLSEKVSPLLFKRRELRFVDVGKADEVKEVVAVDSPHVILVGPSVPSSEGLALARELAPKYPGISIVLISSSVSTELLKEGLRVGIRDIVSSNDSSDSMAEAILEAYDAAERYLREQSAMAGYADSPSATVITVFGTKGGVGKSTLASNLAVLLSKEFNKRTILLDLDLQFGDIGIMLQLPPERTIHDAVEAFGDLDAEMLKGFLVEHESGVQALLAPVKPEEAESITSDEIATLLSLLTQLADYVVVDTPALFSDIVLTALDKSDKIYAVATMDVPSIKNTRISVQKLDQLGYADRTRGLVLNRAGTKVGLETHEVAKATGCNIVAEIPSDRVVPRAINRGVPVVLDAPRSGVTRSMLGFAKEIASNGEVLAHVA